MLGVIKTSAMCYRAIMLLQGKADVESLASVASAAAVTICDHARLQLMLTECHPTQLTSRQLTCLLPRFNTPDTTDECSEQCNRWLSRLHVLLPHIITTCGLADKPGAFDPRMIDAKNMYGQHLQ